MRAVLRFCALLPIAAVLFAASPAFAADPFSIDVVLPLTGPNTFIGQHLMQGYQALQKTVNDSGGIAGRQLNFVYHDDQTNPQNDVQLVNDIISRKGAAILGPASASGCQAVLPLVKDGPVLYCLSPSLHPPNGSYAFSVNVSTADTIGTSIHYFVQKGAKRIAVITANDAVGQDGDVAIDAAFEAMKAQSLLVDREHFSPTDMSVAAQATRIKAANPDLIIAWTTGAAFGTILHGLKDVGLDVPVFTTNGNSTRAFLSQFTNILPKDLYFPDAITEIPPAQIADARTRRVVEGFLVAMNAVGVTKPDTPNEAGWDAGRLIVDAYRKLGVNATAAQIRSYIANTKDWVGIRGPYDFRTVPQRGLSQSAILIVRWDAAADGWTPVSKLGGTPLK